MPFDVWRAPHSLETRRLVAAMLGVMLMLPCSALAASAVTPIPSLFSTGVEFDGSQLPDGSVDPHYTLVSVPRGFNVGPVTFVTDSDRYPLLSDWMPNGAGSKWISPTADQSVYPSDPANVPDQYVYRTYFDLGPFVPSTAVITGRWATDNDGLNILLNGTRTGITSAGFHTFTPFSISQGFVDGINTLDFVVQNIVGDPHVNPTGLRVQIAGTAIAPLPGDANRDGTVSFTDLLILAQHYGMLGATWSDGDFSGDGRVDFNDLTQLAQNYGHRVGDPVPASSARSFATVPVPSSVVALALATIARLGRRSRGPLN